MRNGGAAAMWRCSILTMTRHSSLGTSVQGHLAWQWTPTCFEQVLSAPYSERHVHACSANGMVSGLFAMHHQILCDAAGAFPYAPRHTDFLLVRAPTGALSLRQLSGTIVVGQQEPHVCVPWPFSKEARWAPFHTFFHLLLAICDTENRLPAF